MSERGLGYFLDAAVGYARGVLAGEIPACKWTKAACRRQLDDLERAETDPHFPFVWRPDKAEHICRFLELLPHIKGEWAGQKIQLEAWQIFILTTVFGWYRKNGRRRFRTAYIEVPRKNAKSTLSSGVALYMLTADGEAGAEVYSAATTRDQARIVFDDAKQMASMEPGFRQRFGVKVLAHSIYEVINNGRFVPLSAEGSTLDGLNIHFAVVDELHAHKTRAVYDVLETGTGARAQSLLWNITTAGDNRAGICYEQRSYVTGLLNSVLRRHDGLGYPVKGTIAEDDTYFGIIYTIDDEDDWADEKCWAKANPNYNVSIYPDDIKRLAEKAERVMGARNNFLTKRLNVWVNAAAAWMDMRQWDKCNAAGLSIDDFAGRPCWIGMDLAEKRDIAAIVAVFERDGRYFVFPRFYLNDEAIEEGSNSQYEGWREAGHLCGNPGNVTDFDRIAADLKSWCEQFDVREIPFDPALTRYFATKLLEEGLPLVEMRQAPMTFTSAITELENFVAEGKIVFDGNPVMTWMASNVVIRESRFNGLKHPGKERDENKIDGVVALLMALARALTHVEDNVDDFINNPVIA